VDDGTYRFLAGALAVICVIVIVVRRKNKRKASSHDEF